jgi:hypothetical protein
VSLLRLAVLAYVLYVLREHAELVARADAQHAWVLAGDDRGVYGDRSEVYPTG